MSLYELKCTDCQMLAGVKVKVEVRGREVALELGPGIFATSYFPKLKGKKQVETFISNSDQKPHLHLDHHHHHHHHYPTTS